MGLFAMSARTQSGMIRLFDQSPPPMTFPARADAAPKSLRVEKNDLAYEAKTSSAAAFEADYGSCPPSSSDSTYPRSISLLR